MQVSRWLLDTIGVIAALLCGCGYFALFFAATLCGCNASRVPVAVWITICILAIFVLFAILNYLLRPTRGWVYPVAFSTPAVISAILQLLYGAGPNLLIAAGLTVAIALASSYATRPLHSWMARSNNRWRVRERQ